MNSLFRKARDFRIKKKKKKKYDFKLPYLITANHNAVEELIK